MIAIYNFVTRDRETGTLIGFFATLNKALAAVREYEGTDREDGCYTEDFYEIRPVCDLPPVQQLRVIRSATGLTQARFADVYRIPRRTLENWEAGTRTPPSYVLRLLETVIQLTAKGGNPMNRYNFTELRERATAPNAHQGDVNALGEWFEAYGSEFWNGECYDASLPGEPTGSRSLYPIYGDEDESGCFPILGYEFR